MKIKCCCTCKQTKPFSKFYRDKTISDGFARRCKSCKKEYRIKNIDKIKKQGKVYYQKYKKEINKEYREYYQENRTAMIQRAMKWNGENPVKFNKSKRKWAKNHPEATRTSQRKWYLNNTEKARKQRKKWVQENRELYRKCQREYYHKHLEKCRQYHNEWNRRHSTPKTRLDSNMSVSIWKALKNKKGGRSWKDLVGYSLSDLVTHLESQFEGWMSWENYGNEWEVDHIKPRSLFFYQETEDEEFKECWSLKNLRPLSGVQNRIKYNKYPYVNKKYISKTTIF